MRALVFGVPSDLSDIAAPNADPDSPGSHLLANLHNTPMALQELPDPKLVGPDWVVLRTRMTGICGSDSKQVFMDTGGDSSDFAFTSLISFPQVLGHEVIADVVEAGPESTVAPGTRVALNCWLSCGPRGITPQCPECQMGNYSSCWSFTAGRLTPGIHTGNSSDATGGFADLLPAHDSMAIPVPDGIPDEIAVLADPFAVSLHAITRNPPPPHSKAVVWGAGALGSTNVAILRALYPTVEVGCVARHGAQQELVASWGATVFDSERDRSDVVVAIADWSGGVLHQPWAGLPVCHPGHVASVYDTIGTPSTIEMALRVLGARGQVVVTGVNAPGRFEWSPLYFKDARIAGSNAFGIEEIDGVRQHAIAHYLDMVLDGRIDISAMLTHTFRLEDWRDAFTTIAKQHETGAIKVAFDFR
jgi:threonine dehydrogenase-like Zn-dependent dehydrogenase